MHTTNGSIRSKHHDGGLGIAGMPRITNQTRRLQWAAVYMTFSIVSSSWSTTRERSFQQLRLRRMSSNRITTSSIMGRLEGSGRIISVTRGRMKSNPSFDCPQLALNRQQQGTDTTNLNEVLHDGIPNIEDVSGKWIARFI